MTPAVRTQKELDQLIAELVAGAEAIRAEIRLEPPFQTTSMPKPSWGRTSDDTAPAERRTKLARIESGIASLRRERDLADLADELRLHPRVSRVRWVQRWEQGFQGTLRTAGIELSLVLYDGALHRIAVTPTATAESLSTAVKAALHVEGET